MRRKLDGEYSMPNVYCISCLHFLKWDSELSVCKAFPNGIPLEIWHHEIDHLEPYEEDNGYQYEEKNTKVDQSIELIEDDGEFDILGERKTLVITKLSKPNE